ncbi:alpha/beta hydrolase [Flavobacterium sp. UMI-01]|uniref:alpha/beta hydrolase n=1 Tax=Flavobacterium sp. UMI-01 TaxID=1441053 RepID=UPI001C7D29FA|nr:alpha/beta hydrolase [Flavobacterium sp. UMI-01]GIZ09718.1 lipase [Flavobacterium sp. UMI-01]
MNQNTITQKQRKFNRVTKSSFTYNWSIVTLIFTFFLSSTLSLQAQNEGAKETFSPDKIQNYKSVNGVDLALHIFNPKKHSAKDKTPVIIFFFGGGWNSGNPNQFYQQARYFADRGMVAISADYRVKQRNQTTPFEAVKDAKSAVRWVREHARELGINPNKLVASGGSAGGHLAVCTGIIEGYEEEGENLSISSVPNAMILFNPVLDTTEKGYGMKSVGETNKTAISPVHHIKKGIVPTMVFHGTADTTVPFENAERFASLMKEAGNECSLESYEGKGHGFFNSPFFSKKADVAVYEDIMKKCDAFLVSKSYLSKK